VIAHLGMATLLFGLILTLAILANLNHVPPRWRAWIRRVSEVDPPREPTGPEGRPMPERGGAELPRGS